MDRTPQNPSKQQTPSKIYELLANTGNPGQGLERMMRTLENEANIINSANENARNNLNQQQNSGNANESSSALGDKGANSTLELLPSIVLQNLGLSDEITEDRPHMCQICNATYKTRTHLRRHMFVHLSNRPYPCSECGKGFNRKEHLNKHIEAVHSGTKYKCEYCGKEISRKDHLSRHIKNMHTSMVGISVKSEPCTDDQTILKVQLPCGQKQKAQLSFISPSYSPPGSPCSEGGGGLGDTTISPIQNSYNSKQARFKAVTQQQHIPSGQSMMLPGDMMVTPTMITSTPKSSGGSRNQANNGIPGSMTQISVFSHNRNSVNNSGPGGEKQMLIQLFTCTECSATFTIEKDLTIHSRIHKPQPYKCAECPRAYTRREKLTEHIRCFHQGQKFTCEYCGKELSRKDHVLRHVRSVHPEVLANRFVNMSEGDLDGNGNGQQIRTNSTPLQGNNGSNIPSIGEMGVLLRSVCHICLKVFGTSYHLSRHIESCHNGDIRPYACSACSKQFKRKDHLTKHMKSHCPSMRESSNVSRVSSGVKSSFNSMEMHSTGNIGADNSSNLNNIDVDLSGIHPDAIDSLQIEMMSPGGEDEENAVKCAKQSNEKKNSEDDNINENDMETNRANEAGNSVQVKLKYSDGIPVIVERRDTIDGNTGDNSSVVDNEFSLAVMNSFLSNDSQATTSHNSGSSSSMKAEIAQLIQVSNAVNDGSSAQRQLRYPCGHCQKEFTSRTKLGEHLQEHCNEKLMRPLNILQNSNELTQAHSQHIQQNVHQNVTSSSNNLWAQ